MKKISLALIILIIVGICIPAASAEEIMVDSGGFDTEYTLSGAYAATVNNQIRVYKIQEYTDLKFLYLKPQQVTPNDKTIIEVNPSYSMPVTLKIGSNTVGHGIAGYNGVFDNMGFVTGAQIWVEVTDFDVNGYVGTQTISIIPDDGTLFNGMMFVYLNTQSVNEAYPIGFGGWATGQLKTGYVFARSNYYWENKITVSSTDIDLIRNIDGTVYPSNITVVTSNSITDFSGNDVRIPYVGNGNWYVTSPYGKLFTGDLSPATDTPTNTVTVYIKNSQTGALIADANIVIDALVNGEYYPVVNRTEPSGIFSITLQPTGGGHPNPDGYRLIATADGYNNPMPEINFTVDDYKLSLYCLLDPIAGGPENENKTFIDFFVSDMYANPISGATVKFGKYTLITNSAGYTVFEVDKSNTYTWIVSKSGYGPLTGNAVIGDAPRHTINTVLAPTVTPTKPTPTSTSISPTPTMTAPTGEPVSNWLEWFAAHFGMILGGGVEIGKIFMWLCFTIPVGVYVGKEAKAGAAGFMAGAGVVTLFFVLIGWVPIWLVVLLALIIGLLYAKVFNTPDNGGGR